MEHTTSDPPKQDHALKGTCPYCLTQIDVYLDVKHRPYWTCPHCNTRTFAGRATLDSLKQSGWIWVEQRPLDALRNWLARVAAAVGLPEGKGQ